MEEKTEAQRGAVTCLRSHSKEVQSWEWNSNLLSWSAGVMFKMLNCRYSGRRTYQNRDTSHSPATGPGGSAGPGYLCSGGVVKRHCFQLGRPLIHTTSFSPHPTGSRVLIAGQTL